MIHRSMRPGLETEISENYPLPAELRPLIRTYDRQAYGGGPSSPAFKHIDQMWPDFKFEPRNLKLGVGLDGVNPFSMQSSKWSTWPVIIIYHRI